MQERIRRGYRALGPGAHRDVLAMFDQAGGDPARWLVRDAFQSGRGRPSQEIVALDLFGGLPARYEVIGVDVRLWRYHAHCSRLVVGGRYRVRPRGTWEVVALPFVHIWHLTGDRADRVTDCLSGVELRRLAAA